MRTGERERRWYPLDNAARIFPSIASADFPTVFRLSATLDRPVSIGTMQNVTGEMARRFPYFRVTLRRGFFWYYLEERSGPFPVTADLQAPCSREPHVRRNPEVLRILVRGNRIAVEFSHILTDGAGAREFFRSLILEYLIRRESLDRVRVTGQAREMGILVTDDVARECETEYSYRRFYSPHLPKPLHQIPAWHLPGPRLNHRRYHVTTLIYDVPEVKTAAKRLGVAMTEYLIAVFLFAFQTVYESVPSERGRRNRKSYRPLRILVPVDLRTAEGSRTLRNFFVFLLVELDIRLGHYELAEIAHKVHHQMGSEMDSRNLRRHVTRNVKPERNFVLKMVPVFLKDAILRAAYRRSGERVNTASFSNLMSLRFPADVEGHIHHVDFLPPPSPVTGTNATMVSIGSTLSVSFGSRMKEHAVERAVAQSLHHDGLRGKVITNWGWEE